MTSRFTKIASFGRASLRSRLGWILVCLHAAWFFLAIANMSPPSRAFAKWLESLSWSDMTLFAGRPFHFYYESLAMKLLILADSPAEIAEIPADLLAMPLLKPFHMDLYSGSYVDALLMLLLASLQWLAFGRLLESRLSARRWGLTFLAWVQRNSVLLVTTVLLFTAIATPLVNAHSRKVAYHRRTIPSQ